MSTILHIDLCSLDWMSNSTTVHCDGSLKAFLQTLKHWKQSHKCIPHDHKELLEIFFFPLETWPTLRLRPMLANSDISSLLDSCHPQLLQSTVKVQRPNTYGPNSLSNSDGKETAPLMKTNNHSFHLRSSWAFFSKHIHILSLVGSPPKPFELGRVVTDGETEARRGEVTFSVSDKAESRAPASWFQILVCPVDHTAINRAACCPQF